MAYRDSSSSNNNNINYSPSSSSTSSTTNRLSNPTITTTTTTSISTATATTSDDPMHSWWESISKARARIHALTSILPSDSDTLLTLADSDRPALSLLSSPNVYAAISRILFSPISGSGSDPLCHWLYDTYLSADPHLRLVVLSFLPLLSGLYLTRVHSTSSVSPSHPSLAGFEAVLLAIYASEVKARNGKPLLVQIPDLSQPSLYHIPRITEQKPAGVAQSKPSVGFLSPALEPQVAVKSTKRACIVGVTLDCYYKQISQMPSWSKLEFCQFAASWAGQDCPCKREFDNSIDEVDNFDRFSEIGGSENGDVEIDSVVDDMGKMVIHRDGLAAESTKGSRIPLPWELLQPMLRILGHCLLGQLNSQDVKDAASAAIRCLYARASHDLVPQAILATRSLIKLDNRAKEAAKVAATANASSNVNTPSKAKKPEILLASK